VTTALIHTIADARCAVATARQKGARIGLVPTMGALHVGHGALIRQGRQESDFVIVSLFVNPIQFDRKDDFQQYPRTIPEDLEFCQSHGVDAVFAPSVTEMYQTPQLTFIEVSQLSDFLCGQFRPGHFRGVATVVNKLFNIIQPDRAYFGEKDAQQLAIIQKMVTDLNIPVTVVPVATVREADGLAISSRNRRLRAEERQIAPKLYQALLEARSAIGRGCVEANAVKEAGMAVLRAVPQFRVEYFEIVDPATQQPVQQILGPVRIAAAAWLGQTRLIDNVRAEP
jgi:pantoate--beta-alanine ligase